MRSILTFDELNSLGVELRSMPYEQYFGEMDLTAKQKEDRIEFARQMEDVVRIAYLLMLAQMEFNVEDTGFTKDTMQRRYSNLVAGMAAGSILIRDYIPQMVDEYIDTTLRRQNLPYTFSEDRLVLTAENEANTVFNEEDFLVGLDRGFSRKQWVTQGDNHVRETHAEVNGEIIPIEDYFEVGGSLMRFPKDFSMSPAPEETVNCRCTIKYLR